MYVYAWVCVCVCASEFVDVGLHAPKIMAKHFTCSHKHRAKNKRKFNSNTNTK